MLFINEDDFPLFIGVKEDLYSSQWKCLSRKSNSFYRIIVSNDFVPIEYSVIIPTFVIHSISKKSSTQGIIWCLIIFQVFGVLHEAWKCTVYGATALYDI